MHQWESYQNIKYAFKWHASKESKKQQNWFSLSCIEPIAERHHDESLVTVAKEGFRL
jgi:hypothetical protein